MPLVQTHPVGVLELTRAVAVPVVVVVGVVVVVVVVVTMTAVEIVPPRGRGRARSLLTGPPKSTLQLSVSNPVVAMAWLPPILNSVVLDHLVGWPPLTRQLHSCVCVPPDGEPSLLSIPKFVYFSKLLHCIGWQGAAVAAGRQGVCFVTTAARGRATWRLWWGSGTTGTPWCAKRLV